jgi:hypothetical protein
MGCDQKEMVGAAALGLVFLVPVLYMYVHALE